MMVLGNDSLVLCLGGLGVLILLCIDIGNSTSIESIPPKIVKLLLDLYSTFTPIWFNLRDFMSVHVGPWQSGGNTP